MRVPEVVLVVAAHPDDEVLGCGGTAARLAREGKEVYVSIMAEGVTSRYERPEEADRALLKSLHARCREAGKIMGAREVFLHGLPDNRLDTIPLLNVVKIVEAQIQKVKPSRIYTHHGGDLNIDHSVVHRAVLTATRPMQGCPVKELLLFEVASSTEWAFHCFGPFFRPNVFVDISETLETKIQAMRRYESEIREYPHPRSPEALTAIARRWGIVVGCPAAEGFELVRALT